MKMETPSTSSSSDTGSSSSRWRTARRLLLGAATVLTLIAILYTIENWRGKRAWLLCRDALESKGEVLDWAAFIPAPVPDDQNFYKAPRMQEWFARNSLRDLVSATSTPAPRPFSATPPLSTRVTLAEATLATPGSALNANPGVPVVHLNDPAVREQVTKLMDAAIGPYAFGATGCLLLSRTDEEIKPSHWVLQADRAVTAQGIVAFLSTNWLNHSGQAAWRMNDLQAAPTGHGSFRISLQQAIYGAADYLDETQPLTSEFDQMREALKRPYARLDGDYRQPYAIAVPDFVTIRLASQMLAQRAQCHLLLRQPEEAWHELALVLDLCRILEPQPERKPVTLVAAMINVAVAGLYTSVVQDGLRLHAWGEPQLQAIQAQLHQADLLRPVVAAFREERAATCLTFESTKRSELIKLFDYSPAQRSWREQLDDWTFRQVLAWMPRGWFHQNMVVGSQWEQEVVESVDLTNRLVHPGQVADMAQKLSADRRSPYQFLVARALPNFVKALLTAAHNQVLVSQAELACALERERLSQGQYPRTLEALAPRFVPVLPHDLVGGRPFNYRPIADGGYRLYSVGWNEIDDGGRTGPSREEGDWVWEQH